ncbi:MAG: hypothetical protein AB1679_21610 [Actinomycetota bacterium]
MDLTEIPTPDYSIELPGGWYAYDPDPQTRPESIVGQVDARIEFEPHLAAVRTQLIEIVTQFAEDADEAGARLGAIFWEPGDPGAVAAQLMVLDGARVVTDSVDGEVADLLDRLARPLETDVGPRDVTRVELPAGPAARIQLLARTVNAGPGGADYVLDLIQFWVPAPAHPTNVVVAGETPCLDLDVQFAEAVEDIARTLQFAG